MYWTTDMLEQFALLFFSVSMYLSTPAGSSCSWQNLVAAASRLPNMQKKMPACAELQRLDRNLLWASCPTHHQQLLPKSSQNQGNGWHYNVLTWFVLCDFCMEEKSALWGWAWQKQTMWDRWSIAFKSLIRLLAVFGSSGFLHYAEFGSCGFCTGMRLVQGLRRN